MEQDFLDEMIEESTKRNPEFPSLMEKARQRRAMRHPVIFFFVGSRFISSVIYHCFKRKNT